MKQPLIFNDMFRYYQEKPYNGRIFQLKGIIVQELYSNSWPNISVPNIVEEGHLPTTRKISGNQGPESLICILKILYLFLIKICHFYGALVFLMESMLFLIFVFNLNILIL